MPYGLRVWDEDGNLTVDYSSKLPRFVATGTISSLAGGATSSNITVTGMTNTSDWFVFVWVTASSLIYPWTTVNKNDNYFTVTNGSTVAQTYAYAVLKI